MKYRDHKNFSEQTFKQDLRAELESIQAEDSGPVYTILFSNEDGTKSCRFGLPFSLKCFHNRHQMKTILKTEDLKRRDTLSCKPLKMERFRY